jgi:parvulin-like peptidyl-prolyl isomerase
MQKMRQFTKEFLIFVVVAFVGTIIFDWGMDITGIRRRPDVMGEVNGERIMADKYYEALRNQIELRRQQGDDELTDQELSMLEDQVWESLVQEILLRQEIEKRGITASDSEVVAVIKYNPPDILRSNESFLTDGKFDYQKYLAALRDPRNDWRPVEEYVRTIIPFQKLQDEITASVVVTPEEVRWEYIKRNQKAKVKYIFFDADKISDDRVVLEEQEIQKYYEEHKEEYREPEKRVIRYAFFPLVPSAADSQAIWNDAMDLLKRARSGEDFASLAEMYSEDPGSRDKGGDLGFFGRGTMVKPFEDAAFQAKAGEIVGPVQTSYGLHIIKVEEKKRENGEWKVRARHILLKYQPSTQTVDEVRTRATLFAMDAIEFGIEEAAKRDSVELQETPPFTRGGFIPGIGFSRDLTEFVFSGEKGDIREQPFETDRGFVVAMIADIQKEHIKPLEDVQTMIRNILLRIKKKEIAGQLCAEARQKMTLPEDFEKVAAQDSLEIKETTYFTRNDFIPGVGREPSFVGAAFSLEPNQISNPVEGTRGYFLIKLLDKTKIDEADFEQQKMMIYNQLLFQKKQRAFMEWYNELKKKADIKDYRRKMA